MSETPPPSDQPTRSSSLPPGAELVGESPEFTHDSVPDALRTEHQTAAGRWALLEVLQGALDYIDLAANESRRVATGQSVVIEPEQPHKVGIREEVRFRLRFFRGRDLSGGGVSA